MCGYYYCNRRKLLGFTLLELLVVVAIIGLLAAVVLSSLNSARLDARDARRIAEVRSVVTALELYYSKYGVYPCGVIGEGIYSDPPNGTIDADIWRDPSSPFGPNFMDGLVGSSHGASICIGEPKHGLVTEGLLPDGMQAPSVDGTDYIYVYHVTRNRKGYLFTVTLESNDDVMLVDNGPRDCAYEVAGGTEKILDYNYFCLED